MVVTRSRKWKRFIYNLEDEASNVKLHGLSSEGNKGYISRFDRSTAYSIKYIMSKAFSLKGFMVNVVIHGLIRQATVFICIENVANDDQSWPAKFLRRQ